MAALVAAAPPPWQQAFSSFALGLIDWAETRVDPALIPEFRGLALTWCKDNLPWEEVGAEAGGP